MRLHLRPTLALLGAAVMAVTTFGFAAPAQADFHGAYIESVRSRKCVSAIVGSTDILQEPCTDAPGQTWLFGPGLSTNQPFQLSNFTTGKCIDITSFGDGAPVVQTDCTLQQIGSYWLRQSAGTIPFGFSNINVFRYKSAFANVCLDLENGLPDNGLPLQVWTCNNNTDNQRWFHVGPPLH